MFLCQIDPKKQDGLLDDVIFTLDQIEAMTDQLRQRHGHRVKRKMRNFVTHPVSKWTFPIKFAFDGTHGKWIDYMTLYGIVSSARWVFFWAQV